MISTKLTLKIYPREKTLILLMLASSLGNEKEFCQQKGKVLLKEMKISMCVLEVRT